MTTTTPTTQHLAAEIRAELARRGWSQGDLADTIGEKQGWVSRRLSLNTLAAMTVDDAVRMCEALELDIAELLATAPATTRPISVHERRRNERRHRGKDSSEWSGLYDDETFEDFEKIEDFELIAA